jgi:hypothetical protein
MVLKHINNFTFSGSVYYSVNSVKAYRILVGEPERKRQLGRHRRRWEDDVRMDLGKYGGKLCIGCIWLKTGTSGRLLQEGLCSMECV